MKPCFFEKNQLTFLSADFFDISWTFEFLFGSAVIIPFMDKIRFIAGEQSSKISGTGRAS